MSDVQLIQGDCVEVMRGWYHSRKTFHLVYIDPPFFTQQDYFTRPHLELAFTDRWPSMDRYVESVTDACKRAHELLTDDGSLVVHLDPRTSHHVKVELDTLLRPERFASEIIWRYRRWPTKTPNFQRVHDVLLRYVKDPDAKPRWTQLYEPLAASTRKQWGTGKQKAVTKDGRRVRSSTSKTASPGVAMGDVWDIGIIAPSSRERTGFPTQKSLKLMDRLVLSLTYPGDTVLDPMCGSGSMLVSAARLGRGAVGIDSSPVAIRYARERLGLAQESA